MESWTLKRKEYWDGIIDRSFLFVNRKHLQGFARFWASIWVTADTAEMAAIFFLSSETWESFLSRELSCSVIALISSSRVVSRSIKGVSSLTFSKRGFAI